MLNEEYTSSIDLLADTFTEAIAMEVEERIHYIELSRFEHDMPKNEEQRKIYLNALINAVKQRINDADVYISDNCLFVEEL
ncbi:MAG: hypothetical protein MJ154_00245 [Candidatus Saccharibacteria bacterium]|nr:hypothetical protein [Candidatus Saccharibacteria bacterium]